MSLDSLLDNLVQLSETGDCVARVECLLKDLKALEENAQVPCASGFKTMKAFLLSSQWFVPSSPRWKRPSCTPCTGTS